MNIRTGDRSMNLLIKPVSGTCICPADQRIRLRRRMVPLFQRAWVLDWTVHRRNGRNSQYISKGKGWQSGIFPAATGVRAVFD